MLILPYVATRVMILNAKPSFLAALADGSERPDACAGAAVRGPCRDRKDERAEQEIDRQDSHWMSLSKIPTSQRVAINPYTSPRRFPPNFCLRRSFTAWIEGEARRSGHA